MRAVVARDARPAVAEIDAPSPGEGEVLVRVAATAVNRADLLQVAGAYPPPAGAPETLGLELSGEVASGDRSGERVMAIVAGGGYAELALVPESHLMPVPDGMDLLDAAAIPEAFLTAWSNMVEIAGLSAGETVLIHAGASGVGLAATQIAAALGCRVIATASSAKHEYCTEAGAARVVDYQTEDFGAIVEAEGGANVIVDFIGEPYLDGNLRAVRKWGRIVYVGLMGGRTATIDLGQIMRKRLSILGSTLRDRTGREKAGLVNRFASWALPRFVTGELRPTIWRILPLDQAAEAHDLVRANANAGKIVLKL